MSAALGSFCLVLHGHLPYVLRHGHSPHGEVWLNEAAAETYLPLLELIDDCAHAAAGPHFAIGLTPILLEQLAHGGFRDGFRAYLAEQERQAETDRAGFDARGEKHFAYLAERWRGWYRDRAAQFDRYGGDICRAFAERHARGRVQVLSSAATHAYLPLMYEDASVRAQIRAGLASSQKILGFRPRGFWLPECAYRPRGRWSPPIAWPGKDARLGIDRALADEGVTHVFLPSHLVEGGRAAFVRDDGHWHAVDSGEADKYRGRGWRSVHELHGFDSVEHGKPNVVGFARDAAICEQVWSGSIGYPADGVYLEFHKHHAVERGLRYWKITGTGVDLGRKDAYHPDDVAGRVYAHAQHFCGLVKDRLRAERARTGRAGVVVATFDAELFGHWWFEGPRFLRDVLLTLHADPEVDVVTPETLCERAPPDKVIALPEGSWGEGGDHRVWTDPRVHWMWEIEYRCEATFGRMTYEFPWRENERLADLLRKAGRELLLLQASDWPFAITRGQAVDYGIKRFVLHVARFETLTELCEMLAETPDASLDALARHAVEDADLHDVVFADVDLDWWNA